MVIEIDNIEVEVNPGEVEPGVEQLPVDAEHQPNDEDMNRLPPNLATTPYKKGIRVVATTLAVTAAFFGIGYGAGYSINNEIVNNNNDNDNALSVSSAMAVVKKGSNFEPMKGKDSKKKSGLSHGKDSKKKSGLSKSSKCSRRIDMDDNEDDLMWIMDDKPGVNKKSTCAQATGKQIKAKSFKVRGELCNESKYAQRWEIRQLEGFVFQIRTQSEDPDLADRCTAVDTCADGAPLLMVECDTCEDGPPNPKTLWYTSNVGTTNSYYCAFNVISGMYYISPSPPFTDENWKISDSAIGASVEGQNKQQVVGMHYFWKGLPDPNPGYCTDKDTVDERDTC